MTDSKLKDLSDGVAPSKGAWTPGPWEAAGLTIIESSGQHRDIGEMFSCHEFTVEISEAEALANAKLISKSPQMAELLRRIIEELPSKRDWLDPDLEQSARALLTELEGR